MWVQKGRVSEVVFVSGGIVFVLQLDPRERWPGGGRVGLGISSVFFLDRIGRGCRIWIRIGMACPDRICTRGPVEWIRSRIGLLQGRMCRGWIWMLEWRRRVWIWIRSGCLWICICPVWVRSRGRWWTRVVERVKVVHIRRWRGTQRMSIAFILSRISTIHNAISLLASGYRDMVVVAAIQGGALYSLMSARRLTPTHNALLGGLRYAMFSSLFSVTSELS